MAALDGAIPAIIGAANAAGRSHQVDRSLRFNSGDSSKLTRTFSASNRKTFTYSCWVKRTQTGTKHSLFHAGSTYYRFDSGDDLYFYHPQGNVNTDALFRDPSAWYHIVLAVDTTQSTAANRVKIYVNGTLASLSGTYPNQNVDVDINSAAVHTIGSQSDFDVYLNGYLAEVNFIDGQALAATDFGEYDDNNVWQPKEYSGSYGTNGFYLKFADNSSNAALGTDSSGNSNTWTVNNLNAQSVTGPSTGSSWFFDGSSSLHANDSSLALGSGDWTIEYFLLPWTNYNAQSTHIGYNGNDPFFETDGSAQVRWLGGAVYGSSLVYPNWYHIAYVSDGGQGAIWVNGTRIATNLSVGTYTNTELRIGQREDETVGTRGLLSNVHIVVGTAKYKRSQATIPVPFTPIPVIADTKLLALSTSTLTEDASGNNITLTAPAGGISISNPPDIGDSIYQDSLIDTPTNYEADSGNNGGNYCTLNALKNGQTLSNGNLHVVGGSSWQRSVGTLGMFSGKYYWEYEITASNEHLIGVGPPDMQLGGNLGAGDPPGSGYGTELGQVNGTGANASWTNTGGSTTGDIIGIAFDADNGNMYVYKNGSSLNGGIASHTGLVMPQVPVVSLNGSSRSGVINFGQRPFAYTPPTGYVSLCTQNLAEPLIADGSTAFNATLYTGNGSARNISTPYGPDFVWIKSRSASYDHGLFDVLRGANQRLNANSNGAEGTEANSVTAFNSDSFSLGSLAFYNNPSTTFVAWNWDAGTSTVSNTDGSITSQVRANTNAGFSIVSFTGDGSGTDTIGHGLNATPSTIWLKDRDNNNNWLIFTTAIDGSYDYVIFNSQNTKADSSFTAPTSSVFSYGTAAADYIAYCFAPVAGYSEFGRYAGNGSTDGPFVYTGFRPRFVMVKVYDASDNWVMWDSSRGDENVNALPLYTNLNNSESTDLGRAVDFLSNGFKLRGIDNSVNSGSYNYIYWAFAEHPITTARAR